MFAANNHLIDALEQAAIACRNALLLTDPHIDRERLVSAKGTRVPGTCEWITHNASYRAWLNRNGDSDGDNSNDNKRLLWISGSLGKSKTMMSVHPISRRCSLRLTGRSYAMNLRPNHVDLTDDFGLLYTG